MGNCNTQCVVLEHGNACRFSIAHTSRSVKELLSSMDDIVAVILVQGTYLQFLPEPIVQVLTTAKQQCS